MKKRILAALLVFVALLTGCSRKETTGQWPSQKIEIDVCYTAGGTADTVARQLSALMSQQLSTSFNLVNVTGGSGSIAGQQVYAAAHDGYTWLGDVAHTVSGWRTLGYADLGWEDFYGFYAASSPYVLFVSGNSPYQTAQQLFDAMRGDPSMKWGNAGLLDLAQSGDIRILGICDSSPREIDCAKGNYTVPSLLDDYPELSDLQGLLYWGFRVSRDTPADAVAKIRDAFQSTVDSKEWAQFCQTKGLEPAAIIGTESDEICAKLESIYAWGLYDAGISTINPADYQIPRIEDFSFPANDRTAAAQAWPE